jgi:hypothetical protein
MKCSSSLSCGVGLRQLLRRCLPLWSSFRNPALPASKRPHRLRLDVETLEARLVPTLGTISASHTSAQDVTVFKIQNTSSSDFTQVTIEGIGYNGLIGGVVTTKTLPTISANTTYTYTFADSSGVFAADFDELGPGNARYLFQATSAGQTVYALFSPNDNASGSFVGFLGNDVNGNQLVGANVAATTVGNVNAGTPPQVLPPALPPAASTDTNTDLVQTADGGRGNSPNNVSDVILPKIFAA